MDTIVQWNCQGLFPKWEELACLAADHHPACLALQETLLGSRQLPFFRQYNGFHSKVSAESPHGSALYVRNDVPSVPLTLDTALQAVAVSIFLGRNYTVCSVYLPPNSVVTTRSFVHLISQLPKPFLLLGDLNAHHPLWGGVRSCPRGNMVADTVATHEISILNDGGYTHYWSQTDSYSCIDLSISSSDCVADFTWAVDGDLRGSDHYPLLIKVLGCSAPARSSSRRWNTKRADWSKFHSLTIYRGGASSQDADGMVEEFEDIVSSAASHSMPPVSTRRLKRCVPWWSGECSQAVQEYKRAFQRYRRNPTDMNKFDRNRARALRQRTLRQARRSSMQGYISTINRNTPIAKVWKRVKKFIHRSEGFSVPNLKEAGCLLGDPQKVSDALALAFASVSSPARYPLAFQGVYRAAKARPVDFFTAYEPNLPYNKLFSIHELRSALGSCHPSAPGRDGISYDILGKMHPTLQHYLLDVFNYIWVTGDFPSVWKEAIVLPFKKPGREGTQPTHYRPIALTCCPCKLFERMVNNRLVWVLETNNLITPIQAGFRRKRTTTDQLVRMEAAIREAFAKRHYCVAVFFDIEKAYDTTWRDGILRQLYDWGLRGHLPRFVQRFLSDRLFRVKVGNSFSQQVCQEESVPQGSVLSVP